MSARPGLRSSRTPQKESYPYDKNDTLPPPPIGFIVPDVCPPRSPSHQDDWKNTSYASSGHQSSFEQNFSTRSYQTQLTEDESIHTTPERKNERAQEKPLPESSNNTSMIIWIIIGTIVIGCAIHQFRSQSDDDPSKEVECRAAFKRLMQDHQEQDEDVIRSIFVASQKMLKGRNSLVNSIVLLYSSESSLSFVEDALNSTTGCTPTGQSTPIVLRKENFTAQMEHDPGYVLNSFGDLLKKESIMLVTDVDLLPEGAAQAFHAICDSETPWAKPATVYFTIEIPKDTVVKPENLDRLAIGRLEKSWRGLPPNILDPLITRITNQVLYIR